MKKINWKNEWPFWLLSIVPILYLCFIWNKLPVSIPIHFNLNGVADGWASKEYGAPLLAGINLILYFILLFTPRIDPRWKNYALFARSYWIIRFSIHSLILIIYFMSIQAALGHKIFDTRLLFAVVLILIAVLGNYLRTVRPNYFVGIRTPWTLEIEEVWTKTHRLGGRTMFYSSLAGLIFLFFAQGEICQWIFVSSIAIGTIIPVVFSYFYYRKLMKERITN